MSETAHGNRHTPGTPCWTSLMVRDLASSRDFYRGLFGWEFRSGPEQLGPYVRAVLNGREVAGLGELAPGRQFRIAWMPYLASDDADATADLVRECGGTVAVGPLDSGEAGRMAVAADPSGACFGVWQGGTHLGLGTAEAGAPGTPAWFDLMARQILPVRAFYPAVFGHDAEEAEGTEEERLTLSLAGQPVAEVHGIGDAMPPGRMPHWEVSFATADLDVSVRRVAELGGRVIREPYPAQEGHRAAVADPEGAAFGLIRWKDGAR